MGVDSPVDMRNCSISPRFGRVVGFMEYHSGESVSRDLSLDYCIRKKNHENQGPKLIHEPALGERSNTSIVILRSVGLVQENHLSIPLYCNITSFSDPESPGNT